MMPELPIVILSPRAALREILARMARLFGPVMVIVAAYTAEAIGIARQLRARLFLDAPAPGLGEQLRQSQAFAEVIETDLLSEASAQRLLPHAPTLPRRIIIANGRHSDAEAIAFDLFVRGYIYQEIARRLGIGEQTARTLVRRARLKNRVTPGWEVVSS